MLTPFDYLWFDCLWLLKRGSFFPEIVCKNHAQPLFSPCCRQNLYFHELSATRALITSFDINYATAGKSCSVPPFINLPSVLGISFETTLYSKFFWMSFWFGNLKNSIHCKYCPCLFNILHSLIQVCLELAHN